MTKKPTKKVALRKPKSDWSKIDLKTLRHLADITEGIIFEEILSELQKREQATQTAFLKKLSVLQSKYLKKILAEKSWNKIELLFENYKKDYTKLDSMK